jgi:hypothetical protein
VADIAGIGAAQDARKAARVLLGERDADHAHAVAQEAIHAFREVGELVDQQGVDLGALVFVDVVLLVAVAQEDARAVPEADLVRDDLALADRHPGGEQRAQALRAFQVVFGEVAAGAPEQVDLQARDLAAPQHGADAHQVALAAARRPAVEHLSRAALERGPLLRVQGEHQLGQ